MWETEAELFAKFIRLIMANSISAERNQDANLHNKDFASYNYNFLC